MELVVKQQAYPMTPPLLLMAKTIPARLRRPRAPESFCVIGMCDLHLAMGIVLELVRGRLSVVERADERFHAIICMARREDN